MKKYIIIITFLVSSIVYSQSVQKKEFLNDYAVCTCLAQGYHKIGVKLNDGSSNYWREATFLAIKQDNEFNNFIADYVKKNAFKPSIRWFYDRYQLLFIN